MSYDLRIMVKVAGVDNKYITAGIPEHDTPTYNLGKVFRACMDWDYAQSYKDEDGNYRGMYYNCEEVLPKIIRGINELENNKKEYEQYLPDNGWGSIGGALETLYSLKESIYETSEKEEIPINCLYMCW